VSRLARLALLAGVLGAVLLVALVGGAAARAASPSPFGPDAREDAPANRPATSSPRLLRAAASLRRDPLYVDPELAWTLDAAAQDRLRRDLRAARVPVLVAVLPSVDEDESGGDSERTLQALQRLLRRDAVYVTADQRGWFDVASMGIPLDLSIPFSLTMPRSRLSGLDGGSGDQEASADQAASGGQQAPGDQEAPGKEDGSEERDAPGYTSLPVRLRKMLGYVAAAGPGTPNGPVDDVRPLDELSSTRGYDVTEDVVASIVMGLVLGLTAAGVVLGIRKVVIDASPAAGAPPARSPSFDRGSARGKRPGGKRPGGERRPRAGRRCRRRGA
jgi:hypothetical protein